MEDLLHKLLRWKIQIFLSLNLIRIEGQSKPDLTHKSGSIGFIRYKFVLNLQIDPFKDLILEPEVKNWTKSIQK